MNPELARAINIVYLQVLRIIDWRTADRNKSVLLIRIKVYC